MIPNCIKVQHKEAFGGYLHGEDDDNPYDVDGVSYCGRCHRALDSAFTCLSNGSLLDHRHLKPAPPPTPAPKSPAISRERALMETRNAIQEVIDRADGKPGTALLLLAQIRVKRALENL